MSPDELRALADAIVYRDSLSIARAADYLRACADEKPVGYVTANGLRSLRQDDATVLLYAHDYLIRPDHVALYTRPAPAAPQAEPCIGNDPACPCQDGDACHYKDGADGTKAWPVPQSEPKREPLSDEQIYKIGEPFGYFQYGDAQGDKRRAFVRAIEHAHGISGGSDER